MKLITLILTTMLSFSVYAQTPVSPGTIIQEEGIFLTNEEAAKILAEDEYKQKVCKINLDTQVELTETKCKYEKKNIQLSLDLQKEKYDEIVRLKDQESDNLYSEVGSGGNGMYWFAGGLATGVVSITAASITIFLLAQNK